MISVSRMLAATVTLATRNRGLGRCLAGQGSVTGNKGPVGLAVAGDEAVAEGSISKIREAELYNNHYNKYGDSARRRRTKEAQGHYRKEGTADMKKRLDD